ncbi:MAG: ceramidase [Bryobacteraceae bacterium]|nr:ceramidase [Bryobacteraceae bacterium]
MRWISGFALLSLLALALVPPLPQDQSYHSFADQRPWMGIPFAQNVLSNLAFVVAGFYGIRALRLARWAESAHAAPWWTAAIAAPFIGLGSAYYHWSPDDYSLVWDRLPMTVGFMAIFTVVLAERIRPRASRLLPLFVLVGIASIAVWRISGDLRLYAWVQFFPMAVTLVLPAITRSPYSRDHAFAWLLGLYIVAKLAELFDARIFALSSGCTGGHAWKHLLAGAALMMAFRAVARRSSASGGQESHPD